MTYNPNLENMTAKHGDRATEVLREIADLGGFGTVGNGPGQINPNYRGGLDVAGVLNDSNTAVSSRAKDRIAELCGVVRDSEFKTTSSAEKQTNKK